MPKWITRYCAHCGKPYFGHKSKIYCTKECRMLGHKPPWNKGKTGLPPNRKRNGKLKNCVVCGIEFYAHGYKLDREYCSTKCYFADRWKGEHHIIQQCAICGTEFQCFKSDGRKTCSKKCLKKLKSINAQGEKSHFWRGGVTAPYHKDWKQQRALALQRDKEKCVICGSNEKINVHHLVPYRYSQSHDLGNLITLCRSCHSREEYKVNGIVRKVLAEGRGLALSHIQLPKMPS